MASRSKTKTTFAKIDRERKLAEKRYEKKMRKDARKLAAREGEGEVEPSDAHEPTEDPGRDA